MILLIFFGISAWACSPLQQFECPHGTVTIKLEMPELVAVEKANIEFDQRMNVYAANLKGSSCFNFDDLSFVIANVKQIAAQHGGKVCRNILENIVNAKPENVEVMTLGFKGKEVPKDIVRLREKFREAQKSFSRKHLSE